MRFKFSDDKPSLLFENPPLISGESSKNFNGLKYLIAESDNGEIHAFEIRYGYSCSPFKQAEIFDNLLLVGFEGYFYLYDLTTNENLLALELDGYFGNFTLRKI